MVDAKKVLDFAWSIGYAELLAAYRIDKLEKLVPSARPHWSVGIAKVICLLGVKLSAMVACCKSKDIPALNASLV